MYYINLFFAFSILGFLIENIWNYFFEDEKGSGILIGPWTPIYGIGSLFIIVVFNFIQKNIHLPGWINCYLLAIVMLISLTLIEFIGGILIEKIFHKTFWDYRKFSLSFGKYISLEISLIWAFSSILLAYIIEPLIHIYLYQIPNYLTILFIFLLVIDILYLCITKKIHK